MKSLWDVDRDVLTAITASLHQATRSIDYVSLYVALVAIGAFQCSLLLQFVKTLFDQRNL